MNRNTNILDYHKLCEMIADRLAKVALVADKEIDVDESYIGGRRTGKRRVRTVEKVPVFSLLKRGSKMQAVMIADSRSKPLLRIIRQRILPDSVFDTYNFESYYILDVSEFHYDRINHSKVFAIDRNHINGIENFWNQVKRHLAGYDGIPKALFHLFLKECEWRFNHRPTTNLLSALRKWAKV